MINKVGFLFLLLILLNVRGFAFSDSTYIAQFVIPILEGDDDTEQRGDGSIYFGSSDIELAFDPDNGNQTIGLRFQNIPIPQNAAIQTAYIQFTADEYSDGICDLIVNGEAADNAAPFIDNFQHISNRSLVAGDINWSPSSWPTIDLADEIHRSPDIANIIQQIIDRPGWEQGNSLAVIIKGTGRRVARAYESNPEQAAKLVINVEIPLAQNVISDLFINELMPSNGIYTDEYGEAEDWIELYNGSANPIPIGGLFLSDDLGDLQKWQITTPIDLAPNDFALIWADNEPEQGGLHATFKLKKEGETVYLSQLINGDIVIIDQIQYEETALNLSFGRKQDGSDDWITFGVATPKATNNDSGVFLDRVLFSLDPGIYEGSQSLSISEPISGATIHFTTDGSDPDENDLLYSNPITISSTTTVRARAFKNEYAPGKLATATYIINPNHDIPIFTITTDPENLWNDQYGIYTSGANGIPGWCSEDPQNWNQDWERPATIAMYETNGELTFQKEAGIKIGGGCSRTQSQKSFNLYIRPNTYGDETIEYEIFPDLGITEFQRLKLRNGGQDFGAMIIRDGLNQSLLYNQVDIDLMAYRPTAVYLNGEYWGLYGIREFYTKHHLINHYDVEEGNIDMLVNPTLDWAEVKEGDKMAFNTLFNFIQSNNLANSSNYDYVDELIDIEEFLNYHIVQIYIANYDWPSNNSIAWKPRNGGKWRWMLYDTDASTNFPLWSPSYPGFNSMEFATSSTSTNWPNHRNSTLFLRKLFQNSEFKNEFIQRTNTFIHTLYSDDRVQHFTDSIAAMVENEMPAHINKWGQWNNLGWGITAHGNINEWRSNLQDYKNFFLQRPNYMRNHMRGYFGLSNTSNLHINHTANSHGEVYFHSNEMRIPYQYDGIYFHEIPIKIKAIPDPGYSFLKWDETGDTNAEIDFILNSEFTLTPIFVRNNLIITEIHFDPAEGEDYEFIELFNPTNSSIDLTGFSISGSINLDIPVSIQIEAKSYLLVVKNKNHFNETDCAVIQWDDGNLNNQEGIISIKNASNEITNEVKYNENFPYFSEAKSTGKSLHLLDLSLDNQLGENWIALAPTSCNTGIEYIPYESEELLMSIYPNPASGQVNIRYAQSKSGTMQLSIFNSVGQLVHLEQFRGETYEKADVITINNLSAGVYVFELKNEEQQVLKKVVVY
jgi:CotH protein/chitobiase/beta-hexosaminidase-like protein/type IX secretion system substrate protein/lamin tail-like protein